MLLDTKIVIHACRPGGEWLAPWTEHLQAGIASVTKIEALGFAAITRDEQVAIEEFFASCAVYALEEDVIDRAVLVRRSSKIGAMDAIIAATALERDLTLVTRNVDDFKGVAGLKIVNPFDEVRSA